MTPGENTTYYAVIRSGDSASDPSGIVRRRIDQGVRVDEALHADLTWGPDSAVIQWEYGDVGADLIEVSPDEAQAIIERFREKWSPHG